uniref:Tim44-like domain-containing protein n=1 Tax=Acrobeloides nanus TaxID=290746 RepID=A0A914D9A9_9BILA
MKIIDNVQEELKRNKELQENRKILDQRIRELGESDALKDARKKFYKVEKETAESTELIKVKVKEFKDHIDKMVTDLQKTEAGKKISDASLEAIRQAKIATENLQKVAEQIGDTQVAKAVTSTVSAVKTELDTITDVRLYKKPEALRMRSQGFSTAAMSSKPIEPNTEATDVELHKESRWYASWKNFTDNNTYYNKLLDWKVRYDESENVAVRLVRGITERVSSLLSSENEIATVLSEIAKVDPSFNKFEWLRFCETEIIPNILEASIRGDLEVLEDWCYERAFNIIASEFKIKEFKKVGYSLADSRILDINKVEMVSGKMTEQGPVIAITFQVLQTMVVKNAEGKVIEGDPNKPVKYFHVWVMCRDMEEYNPAMAWRLLELHWQKRDFVI